MGGLITWAQAVVQAWEPQLESNTVEKYLNH
jgi:hypothetical protein